MNEADKTPEELLDAVHDRESFFAFLNAFIDDRERAEQLEHEQPERWQWGGAGNWQNSSISAFLGAASCYFHNHTYPNQDAPSAAPTWRDFASFLYFGKIYE